MIGVLAEDVRTQIGQWLPPYQHTGTPGWPPGWPASFQATHLAVIPQKAGVAASDVVIAWELTFYAPLFPPAGPWDTRYTHGDPAAPGSFQNRFVTIPLGPNGLFCGNLSCSGHCWLPDGRLFIAGGTTQFAASMAFDMAPNPMPANAGSFLGSRYVGLWDPAFASSAPNNFGWTHLADAVNSKPMRLARWYPTVTLISGRYVMVSGGVTETRSNYFMTPDAAFDTYELFDVQTMDWVRDPFAGNAPKLFDGPRGQSNPTYLDVYPRTHLLSNNKAFFAGMWGRSSDIDPDPSLPANAVWNWSAPLSGAWSVPISSAQFRGYGSSVIVPNVGSFPSLRDEIMIIGGGAGSGVSGDSQRILATTAGATWQTPQNLVANGGVSPRMVMNAVLTPIGDIVLIGGSTDDYFQVPSPSAQLRTEVWNRSSGWVQDATQIGKRMYHSTAVLLPSGEILSAGSDIRTEYPAGSGLKADWEIYVPRNMNGGHAQPQFAGAWAGAGALSLAWSSIYYVSFDGLDDSEAIAKVVLMRPCSVTHHSDFDQRYVELAMIPSSGDATNPVQITTPPAPTNGNTPGSITAPPGYYMAFLVSTTGATSRAKWVHLP